MRGSRTEARRRRHFRVRKKLPGTAGRPRLAAYYDRFMALPSFADTAPVF